MSNSARKTIDKLSSEELSDSINSAFNIIETKKNALQDNEKSIIDTFVQSCRTQVKNNKDNKKDAIAAIMGNIRAIRDEVTAKIIDNNTSSSKSKQAGLVIRDQLHELLTYYGEGYRRLQSQKQASEMQKLPVPEKLEKAMTKVLNQCMFADGETTKAIALHLNNIRKYYREGSQNELTHEINSLKQYVELCTPGLKFNAAGAKEGMKNVVADLEKELSLTLQHKPPTPM